MSEERIILVVNILLLSFIDIRIRAWTIFNDFLLMANKYIHKYIFQKSESSHFAVNVD